MSCDCKRFSQLYGKRQTCTYCFNNLDIGREYRCPKPLGNTPIERQQESAWLSAQKTPRSCGGPSHNIGHVSVCPSKASDGFRGGQQVGGGSPLMYSATGNLTTTDKCCGCLEPKKEQDWFNSINRQHGGSGESEEASHETRHAPAPDAAETHPECQEQVNQTQDDTPGTCGCKRPSGCGSVKFNDDRQYKNNSTEISGFYSDMTACAVGNRPINAVHDNNLNIPKTLTGDRSNMKGRKFDCQQPFWCSKCM